MKGPRPFVLLGFLLAIAYAARDKVETEVIDAPRPEPGHDYGEVRDAIYEIAGTKGTSFGPILVRLAWHSSGSYSKYARDGGSNGARMRFSPEKDYGANRGLDVARKALEPIKQKFPWISYADLYTLAGAVAIESMGGPHVPWRPGRTDAVDGSTSPPDGRLPDASRNVSHVRDVFTRLGFGDRETVALIGAHALGECHVDRSGYDGPWTTDPTRFTNQYFTNLLYKQWVVRDWDGPKQYQAVDAPDLMMLPTDMALLADRHYKRYVEEYAKDSYVWFRDFAQAFGKLLELGVRWKPAGGAAHSGDASAHHHHHHHHH